MDRTTSTTLEFTVATDNAQLDYNSQLQQTMHTMHAMYTMHRTQLLSQQYSVPKAKRFWGLEYSGILPYFATQIMCFLNSATNMLY